MHAGMGQYEARIVAHHRVDGYDIDVDHAVGIGAVGLAVSRRTYLALQLLKLGEQP